MKNYKNIVTEGIIPLSKNEKINNAGGIVFQINHWKQLIRFLIIGSEGGSYYVQEKKLTLENIQNVLQCIKEDPLSVIEKVVEISTQGRAYKNDTLMLTLALISRFGNIESRTQLKKIFTKVVRTGTQLFQFVSFVNEMRGWGRSVKSTISQWYLKNDYKRIEFQILKYQKRYGWSHKDVLRLAHVKPDNPKKDQIFQYITHDKNPQNPALEQIDCYTKIRCTDDERKVLSLVKQARFPLEMIPTKWHSSKVLSVVIKYIGYKSLIRNLAKFTHKEVFDDHDVVEYAVHKITDPDIIRRSLIHPISILSALKIYSSGKGYRSDIEFKPNNEIIHALNKAFSLSFSNVQPTGKRILLALDVSASMDYGNVVGIPFLTPRDVVAAIAKVTSEVERKENLVIGAFTYYRTSSDSFSYGDNFLELSVDKIQKISLEGLINALKAFPFSRTDCSLPMRFALEYRIPIDAFVIYTDNETYFNENSKRTPSQSLHVYNKKMNLNAKLIVVATTATDFSIADPDDQNMLDICGFDSNCPAIISDFIAGKI